MNAKLCLNVLLLLSAGLAVHANPILWTGPNISFTDAAGSDPTQAANQDRITADVWITRGAQQGIYNAFDESGFTHFLSPAGTTWATGSLANYNSLSYTDWNTWSKNINGGPPSTVGLNAVVHLVSDDIYLSVDFTSWGGPSGGFSYLRSTAPVPEPSSVALLGMAAVAGFTWKRLLLDRSRTQAVTVRQ